MAQPSNNIELKPASSGHFYTVPFQSDLENTHIYSSSCTCLSLGSFTSSGNSVLIALQYYVCSLHGGDLYRAYRHSKTLLLSVTGWLY